MKSAPVMRVASKIVLERDACLYPNDNGRVEMYVIFFMLFVPRV